MPVEVKVLTSLAGAAIFYIAFLVAVDEVRKAWQEPIIVIVCLKNKLK